MSNTTSHADFDERKNTTMKTIMKKKTKRKLFINNKNNETEKQTQTISKQNKKKILNNKKSSPRLRIQVKVRSSSSSLSTDDDDEGVDDADKEDDEEDDEESQIDSSIEANIQAVANKNNLSSQVIEKILKKVVGNDHVLALVKIKEEEMEKNEKLQKEIDSTNTTQDQSINNNSKSIQSVDCSNNTNNSNGNDDEINQTIQNVKLTRAKARALNQNPLPIPPLKNPTPPPEIAALINEDLCSDEDDEEYHPGEDENQSEDDLNTSISDVDSQPRTPLNCGINLLSDCEGTPPAKYTKDGLFKIPRDRSDSVTSISEQDYIIAKQTRSKVSLAATPIEIIESNFHPPDDIQIDDNDETEDLFVDYNYLAFLNDIFNPSETTTNPEATCIEEDDEDDEDFHVVADKTPADKEEMINARIPKKEYQDLLNELFGDLPDLSAFDCMETIAAGDVTTNNNNINESQSQNHQQQSLSTPPQQLNGKNITNTSIVNFSPQIISSPKTPIASSKLISSRNSMINTTPQQPAGIEYSINPITFSPTPVPFPSALTAPSISSTQPPSAIQSPSVNIVGSSIVIPIKHINPYQGAFVTNTGVIQLPQFQQILISVPTIDLIKSQQENQEQPQASQNQQPQLNGQPSNEIIELNSPEPITKPSENLQIIRNNTFVHKKKKYIFSIPKSHNHFIPFKDAPPVNCQINENVKGFTSWQLDILNQQLQMHTQLMTQHYLQSYAHPNPRLWKYAKQFKDLLNDLYQKTTGTRIEVINLKMAIDLIEEWEIDLTYDTDENVDYIEHFKAEIKRAKEQRTQLVPTFHDKFLNIIINSKVFIYPKLLPLIPMRFDLRSTQIYFHPMEDFLIAFGLEKYYVELQKQRDAFKLRTKKKITLDKVCKEIGRKLLTARQTNRLCKCPIYTHVMKRRQSQSPFNPIQYFYKYKKAPQFIHYIEPMIDRSNMVAPINQVNLSQMSEVWTKHIRRFKALVIDKRLNPRDYLPIQAVAPRIRGSLTPQRVNDKETSASEETSTTQLTTSLPLVGTPFSLQGQSNNENYQTIIIEYISEHGIVESKQLCFVIDNNIPHENLPPPPQLNQNNTTEVEQVTNGNHQELLLVDHQQKLSEKPLETTRQTIILTKKINVVISSFLKDNKQLELFFTTKNQPILLKLYKSIKSIEIYLNLLKITKMDKLIDDKSVMIDDAAGNNVCITDDSSLSISSASITSTDQQSGTPTMTNSITTPPVSTTVASAAPVTVASSGNVVSSSKRNQKCVRSVDMTRLMLLPDTNNDETNEKDALFAQNFMDKVQETYLAENNEEKILEFQEILKLFDPQKERAPALYLKMEKLFMPEHPELAELFLAFLIPGEAAEIGKFMEHFMLTNMSTFLQKLGIFYNKQPAQLRKILASLKELSNIENLQIHQIKEKVIPLLRGNPLLIDWFQQCFLINNTPTVATTGNSGNSNSNNSNCGGGTGNDHDNELNLSNNNNNIPDNEYESLNFHKASEQVDEIDVYEQIPQSDICPDPVDSPCQIRYMNGRIYYGNRILLPAQLSFLMTNFVPSSTVAVAAAASSPLSPPPSTQLPPSAPTTILPSPVSNKNGDTSSEELKFKTPPPSSNNNNETVTTSITLNPPMVTIPVHPQYRCVHAIKQFGDIKVKEQQRAYFENEFNASCFSGNVDESDRNVNTATSTTNTTATADDELRVNQEISIKLEDGNNSFTSTTNVVTATDVGSLEINSSISLTPSLTSLSLNCCDGMTLKAHGIRLNPIAHHTELIKTSDLLDLLKPSDPQTYEAETEKEHLKNSPKKHSQNYRATNTTTATTTTTTTTNIPSTGQKSPINNQYNKRTEYHTSISTSATSVTISKAIVTAKKLKNVISNSNNSNINDNINNNSKQQRRRNNQQQHQQPIAQKKQKLISRKRRRRRRNSSISSESSFENNVPASKIAKTNVSSSTTKLISSSSSSSEDESTTTMLQLPNNSENVNNINEISIKANDDSGNDSSGDGNNGNNHQNTSNEMNFDETTTSSSSSSWSRDEDKIVLEEIKNGFTSENELVDNLFANQLSHRSINEIYERFKFLMDIIASL